MHAGGWMAALLLPLLWNWSPVNVTEVDAPAQAVLSFAGDCVLGSEGKLQTYSAGFVETIGQRGLDYPFSGVKHIFERDDLTVVNLEGTFTDLRKGLDKSFLFRAPPAFAEILPLGSVEAVSVANNHILDYFEEGRQDTLQALSSQGVGYFGDGELAVYDLHGIRVGFTAYSYPHYHTLENLESDIARLREDGCDVIIFSMHAGNENDYRINGQQTATARGAIDLGVDVVIGHHAHVLQAVELYEGKLILYGLGNFSFGGAINPKDWDTMIAQLVLEKDESGAYVKELRIIPCLISGEERWSDYRPVVADGEQAATILKKLGWYSKTVDASLFETGTLTLR